MGVLAVAGPRMGTGKKGGPVWAVVGLGLDRKAKREYASSVRIVVFLGTRVPVDRRRSLGVFLSSVLIIELVIRLERKELRSKKKGTRIVKVMRKGSDDPRERNELLDEHRASEGRGGSEEERGREGRRGEEGE